MFFPAKKKSGGSKAQRSRSVFPIPVSLFVLSFVSFVTLLFLSPSSHALTLVKDGRIDPEALAEVVSIMKARHGDIYAVSFEEALGKAKEPGKELFRVMPNCFINQLLMHFSGTPLSISFRPSETNTCLFCHQRAIDDTVNDSVRQKIWPQTTQNINPWMNLFDPTWLDTVVPPASIAEGFRSGKYLSGPFPFPSRIV